MGSLYDASAGRPRSADILDNDALVVSGIVFDLIIDSSILRILDSIQRASSEADLSLALSWKIFASEDTPFDQYTATGQLMDPATRPYLVRGHWKKVQIL